MQHILFVTGTRADFGKLEPLAVAARDAGFPVSFFVTGMHMLDRYGLTKNEVHRLAGIGVSDFLNQRMGDPQDMILAKTVIGFSDFVAEHRSPTRCSQQKIRSQQNRHRKKKDELGSSERIQSFAKIEGAKDPYQRG